MSDKDEMTAWMLDVDPVVFMNCTASELKLTAAACLLANLGFWPLLMASIGLLFGTNSLVLFIGGGLILSAFSWALCTYLVARWIGKQKAGKPHHYYMHRIKTSRFIRSFYRSPFSLHSEPFAIGRSAPVSKVPPKGLAGVYQRWIDRMFAQEISP